MSKEKILIIGGSGFIGSNVMCWIDQHFLSFEISTMSRNPISESFKCLKNEYIGDFSDRDFIKSVIDAEQFDYIFHCLSTSTPSVSNQNMIEDVENNLLPTLHLLELIKGSATTLVFFSSGGAIYGMQHSPVHRETDIPSPVSSYGVVKNTIEQYIHIYHKLYKLKYIILRISNPFGLYHTSNVQGFINIAIRKSLKNDVMEIWGDGENKKDYIYSLDIPQILFKVLGTQAINVTLNVGSGKGLSINEIIGEVRLLDKKVKVNYIEKKSHDVPEFILDITNLNSLIEIHFTSITEGILKTYEWEKGKIKNLAVPHD